MIFADKLIQLRKKNGLSQEELADKVGVSRQAVSKWESAQSIPDIDKVIALSGLFGVSIDYLLKDEIEIEDSVPLEEEKKKISISKANECITKRQKAAQQIAIGVVLCVCSPIVLILLAGLSDSGYVKESLAALFGIIFLFVLVAIAVTIFVYSRLQISEYEELKKEDFDLEYGVKGIVSEKKKNFKNKYNMHIVLGIILCFIGVIFLVSFSVALEDLYVIIAVCILLLCCSVATYLFTYAVIIMGTYNLLLREEEYAQDKKSRSIIDAFSSCYWLIITGVYLLISFLTENWGLTWIIWPIAGVVFAAIVTILDATLKNKKDK